MNGEKLLATRHYALVRDEDGDVVRVVRTSVPFGSTTELRTALSPLLSRLDALPRQELGLLIDYREAPHRNDDGFEQSFGELRREITRDFARIAYLTRTAVGKLQAQRHAREDRNGAHAFVNEVLAVAFLKQS